MSGKAIIQGTATGSVLLPYQLYEVKLHDGTIFNLEAVPFGDGYQWYSIEAKDLASSIGREIEGYFHALRKKQRSVAMS